MDGFHLARELIDGTALHESGGAIDTLDFGGYVAPLRRLHTRDEPADYAPSYRRGLGLGREEPIATVAVSREIAFAITERSCPLSIEPDWRGIRSAGIEIWLLDPARELRAARLIGRHIAVGISRETATAWTTGPDEANARHIEPTTHLADHEIRGA